MKIFYKPVGYTPNDFKYKLVEENKISKKNCWIGRLDPLARGKLLFLEDNELYNNKFEKYIYESIKEYEAEIILGISTDTDDIMGILDNKINVLELEKDIIFNKIRNEFEYFSSQKEQNFHPYSSYMLKKNNIKQPLWKWKKQNLLNKDEIPKKNIKVYYINFLDYKEYNNEIYNEFIKRISKVDNKHSFRQSEICDQWLNEKNLSENNKIYSIKFRIKVSSGYYLRQFCNDLKNKINYPLTIFDINRINYIIQDNNK